MALKDWKKAGENKWVRKNDELQLITNFNRSMKIEGYTIDIYIFDSRHIIKNFKTKPQALAYAKRYMRKN